MEYLIGDMGRAFISISVLISASGSLLAWIMLTAEVRYIACTRDHLFPRVFGKINSRNAPTGSLIISALAQQIALLVIHTTNSGYLDVVLTAASMAIVPYLCSSAYSILLCIKGETFEIGPKRIKYKVLTFSTIAFLYSAWAFYASTMHNLFLIFMLFAVGTVMYLMMKMRVIK
jgi:arginine:ornithine antiporter/lysine permease